MGSQISYEVPVWFHQCFSTRPKSDEKSDDTSQVDMQLNKYDNGYLWFDVDALQVEKVIAERQDVKEAEPLFHYYYMSSELL